MNASTKLLRTIVSRVLGLRNSTLHVVPEEKTRDELMSMMSRYQKNGERMQKWYEKGVFGSTYGASIIMGIMMSGPQRTFVDIVEFIEQTNVAVPAVVNASHGSNFNDETAEFLKDVCTPTLYESLVQRAKQTDEQSIIAANYSPSKVTDVRFEVIYQDNGERKEKLQIETTTNIVATLDSDHVVDRNVICTFESPTNDESDLDWKVADLELERKFFFF